MTTERAPQIGDDVKYGIIAKLSRIKAISPSGRIELEDGTKWRGMFKAQMGCRDSWPDRLSWVNDADRATFLRTKAGKVIDEMDVRNPDTLAKLTKIMEVLGE